MELVISFPIIHCYLICLDQNVHLSVVLSDILSYVLPRVGENDFVFLESEVKL